MPRRRAADRYDGVSDPDEDYIPGKKRAAPKKRVATTGKQPGTKRVKFNYSEFDDDEYGYDDEQDVEDDATPASTDAAEETVTPPSTYDHSAPPLSLRGGGKTRRANDKYSKARDSNGTKSSGQPTKSAGRRSTRSSRTSPILVDLERLAKEDAAVKAEIARLGLALRDVEGDGNCLFRALSDQMYGDQKRHPELRKLTCDYLEANKSDFEMWVKWGVAHEGESYEAYVTRMRKSGKCHRFKADLNMVDKSKASTAARSKCMLVRDSSSATSGLSTPT